MSIAYGYPRMDVQAVAVQSATLSADRKTVSLTLANLKPGRIYQLNLGDLRAADGQKKILDKLICYTLNRLVTQP